MLLTTFNRRMTISCSQLSLKNCNLIAGENEVIPVAYSVFHVWHSLFWLSVVRFLASSRQIILITIINQRHIVSYDYRIRTKI